MVYRTKQLHYPYKSIFTPSVWRSHLYSLYSPTPPHCRTRQSPKSTCCIAPPRTHSTQVLCWDSISDFCLRNSVINWASRWCDTGYPFSIRHLLCLSLASIQLNCWDCAQRSALSQNPTYPLPTAGYLPDSPLSSFHLWPVPLIPCILSQTFV